MLTEDTADRMKVTDRLDARQSILAGARYLLILKDMLPPRIDEPDRTFFCNSRSTYDENAHALLFSLPKFIATPRFV